MKAKFGNQQEISALMCYNLGNMAGGIYSFEREVLGVSIVRDVFIETGVGRVRLPLS